MRKVIVLLGGLTVAVLFAGAPARAELGCACAKLGAAPVCVSGVASCWKTSGVCISPCDYQAPKMKMRMSKKKKM